MDQKHSSDPNEEVERWFDAFVEWYKDALEQRGDSVSIINPERVKDVEFVYTVMKHLMESSDAKVTYELNEPRNTCGSVSVEGDILEFANSALFIKAAEIANNAEVYPLTNGKVRLSFGFLSLTTPIK